MTVSLAAASTLTLARVLVPAASMTTTGFAVAAVTSTATPACLLALNTLMVNGSINLGGCAAQANSSGGQAITVNGGGSLTASAIDTPGRIVSGGTVSGPVQTGAPAVSDPYASYQAQANGGFSGCRNYANQSTLTPGCWQNVNANGPVTLGAGTYYFPSLNVNSGGSITGNGAVTMVVQNLFAPNGNVTLTAPSSGPWAGMALYAMGGFNANSTISYSVNGAVYSPSGAIYLGGGTWNQSACTYLVAQSITANGGASFTLPQAGCASSPYPHASVSGGASQVALVQ